MIDTSYVDVVFPLRGKLLPLDNGYLIYSALSRLCPYIHENNDIGIHPIAGRPNRYKQLKLTQRSKLKIRIPLEQIPSIYQFLVEQTFKVGENHFHIGIPEYQPLVSASSLYSRIVTIRRRTEPQEFLEVAQRQIDELGIEGILSILKKKNGELQCRRMQISKRERNSSNRGYGVEVTNLSEIDSLTLQRIGIGGRRKMMCGI
ncbi:MAG: type I-MYXAN CRISPR-associated protein Cas6/Cmx6, partial [Cyanobacteria bacterium J06600_6]